MPPWPVLRTGPRRSLTTIAVAGAAATVQWRHSATLAARPIDGAGGGGEDRESGDVLAEGENIRPLFSGSTTTTPNFTTRSMIHTPPAALLPLPPVPAAVRHLSSVPGPLESRKRTGKRHMADIYSLHAFSAPIDYDPGDLTRWEWLAPTPPRPPSLLRTAVAAAADVARRVAGQTSDECTAATAPAGEDPLVVGLKGIEDRVRADGRMTVDVYTAVQAYIVEFARAVHLGLCRETEVTGFAEQLFGVLAPLRRPGDETADLLLSSMVEHVCEAVRRSNVGRPADYSARMWMDLVQLTCTLDQAATEARSLAALMDTMPAEYTSDAVGLVPTVAAALVSSWRVQAQATSKAELVQSILPFPHLTARAAHVLYRFSWHETVASALAEAIAGVAAQADSARDRKMLRFAHMAVAAHLPSVRQAVFLDTLNQVLGASTAKTNSNSSSRSLRLHVPDLQLCTLLLHQWNSRGYLPRPQLLYTSFYGATRGGASPKTTLARFVATIVRYLPAKQHVPTLMSLCEALHQQGRLRDVVSSFVALLNTTDDKVGPHALARLAAACNDADTAAALFVLASKHTERMHGGMAAFSQAWSWKMWTKYVDDMIRRPVIGARDLLTALELRNDKTVGRTATPEYARFIQGVLVKMTHEQRFSARMRLHCLDRCLAFLRSRRLAVRRDLVACYVHLVLRDLRGGRLGRALRMRWVRGLAAAHFSPALVAQLDRFVWRSRRLGQARAAQRMMRRMMVGGGGGGSGAQGRVRRGAGLRGVFERRRGWRRGVLRLRRRMAVGYAQMVWGRRVGVEEAWTLMKNNIRWSQAKLRGERFRAAGGGLQDGGRDVVGTRPAAQAQSAAAA